MKHLQALKDAADRLVDLAQAGRRRLHSAGAEVVRLLKREAPTVAKLRIEMMRDNCEQPALTCCQSFPQFADFPAEIRLLIWHFASISGRIVELQWCNEDNGFRNRAACRPPAVLHACHDSRQVALKTFEPYFGMKGKRNPIYIDPRNDVLFFRTLPGSVSWVRGYRRMDGRAFRVRTLEFRQELKGIRRVAFLWRDFENHSIPASFDYSFMLPDLEEFIMLWADWPHRTFGGRGANFIEGISPCVHHAYSSARPFRCDMNGWEERLDPRRDTRQSEFARSRPVMNLRHWCLRDEEKENIM